ncbi:uncharacterized protein LOC108433477 [Pygocentrus nattereri]|uniref:Isoaspartyl peptidase/L-asparaginase n=1 Tax=Pygocentrus nattereri TaxID=42514 RepID=A0A3B4E797_PYGNA|nr:uncharacterized protein LOC108433477 [Pygocentrus nattereri]XP_017563562.2 uncharacterized protein LOC108433477 [Pygocentrus nattereri]XP_017563563.2 uncharacterized protein LOC108433477 [Pygocentrus nattereri]
MTQTSKMAQLLDYPIPELDTTIKEVGRVLQLILSPEEYVQYKNALSQQREALQEAQKKLQVSASGNENWVTEQFKKQLLSCCDPLPTSTAVPSVLSPSKAKGESAQLERASTLLWAAAKLYSEPWLIEGDVPTERTQQSEVFASSRLPGENQDQLKVYPESLHAIVTCKGGIFPIQILRNPGAEGAVTALPLLDIYTQLAHVYSLPAAEAVQDPSTVCGLSVLHRQTWHAIRKEILKGGGEAAESLEVIESAILAVSLEDCPAPTNLADILNAVRLGGADGQCLRYYDKVVNMVVFKDSVAGMVFEHSAMDGMVAGLVVERMWQLSESQNIEHVKTQTLINGSDVASSHPKALKFPLGGINMPSQPLNSHLQVSNHVITFEVSSFPDVFTTLRGHRGLYDAWINFTLQLSLKQILGETAASHIMVTPTHMRHYKHGRCDPTYSITMQSRKLITALESCIGPDNVPRYTKELFHQFHLAFLEHKNLIKLTKSGHGVGPHLGVLRRSMSEDNPLKKYLDLFGCPSIYLTGSDLMEGTECAVGNVYATNQLAVTYLGKKDKVRLVLNGKGTFASILGKLAKCFELNLKLVMVLAVRYAIAGQMGAIECLLQKEERSINSTTVDTKVVDPKEGMKVKQKGCLDSAPAEKSSFTLVIHGGAGEEMMLSHKVAEVIEFALETALTLGAQVLSHGGSSLDAVQRSVTALEDCFLFNAGKGSVYNRSGEHEMEATIVDGHEKNSGSVACVRCVKNPVKAARHVMEKSVHSLLTGDGAEEFLETLQEREKPMTPEYFHTDVRYKELAVKLSGYETNHPQTVGAVALDCWGKLAAATSTGGLVGKWKGRVGDTAIVGAGIYADKKLAVTCSGDGDAFLRETVAHKVASLYNLKGYTLAQACREVIYEDVGAKCAGIIAVDHKGETAVETNAGVMFVASMVDGVARAEVYRPVMSFANVIWETDELIAHLHPEPWTPGTTILTRKALNGPNSIFQLPMPDYMAMLLGAQTVANLLCEKLGLHRCALVSMPTPGKPAHIKILPMHGVEPNWKPHLAEDKEFYIHDPGYCSSKSGPRCEDASLDQVQSKIRACLPTPDAPSCYDFYGDPSNDGLFSRIVRGEEQQWRVWEDNDHVAFLTPFPNTPGITVLVPRRPLTSDIFRLDRSDYTALVLAAQKVAQLVQEGMGARGVALMFEGFEIDYAHAKLIPLVTKPGDMLPAVPLEFCPIYPGYLTSADGPPASAEALKDIHTKMTKTTSSRTWEQPQSHSTLAIKSQWYRNLFQIQNTLFHSTVEYFSNKCKYAYALTPITTDTISSPMGLGSDSEPVFVNILGQDVYLADSMQFALEYFLRFQEGLPGTYYVSPSFRGEDPDATHLNQFYHIECELLGDMDEAIKIAEGFVAHMTQAMLRNHSKIIESSAGTLSHVQAMLKQLEEPLPRVTLDQAITVLPSADCFEWVQEGQPQFGRKLTRKGERVLIEKYGGAVWLTEMDHLGVPFYQAYVEGSDRKKAKAADLLLGLGETLGLGERHSTPEMVQEALRHHAVPEETYEWYMNMRQIIPLSTSGWGMGTERYLCWLLQHNDVRDMQIIPRLKGKKYMP